MSPQKGERGNSVASAFPTKINAQNATVVNVKEAPASDLKTTETTTEQGVANASPKTTTGQVKMVNVKEAPARDLKTSAENTTEQVVDTTSPKATAGQVKMVNVKEAPASDLKTSTETTIEQGAATASPKAISKRLPSNTAVISAQETTDSDRMEVTSKKHRSNAVAPGQMPTTEQESSSVSPEKMPTTPAATTDDSTTNTNGQVYHTGVLNHLVSPLSLAMVLWFAVCIALERYETIRLSDEGHPPNYRSTKYAAYTAMAQIPFYVTAGWFQANALAAPGNAGWLLGILGPVFNFAAVVATQNNAGNFLGTAIALVAFYGYILSWHSQSRDPMSFALMAFSLVAQFGLAITTATLPALKDALPDMMAGLVAPVITLLYEATGHLFLVMSWKRWGAERKMAILSILTALIVECGEIVRLVGILSAVTAEDPLSEGMIGVVGGVISDIFARTKLRMAIQKAVLNKADFEASAEYELLLRLKYKFGYTPIMVAGPYLALQAAAGDEAARQLNTWLLLLMHGAGEFTTDYLCLLWQNYLQRSAPGETPESLRETLKRVQQASGHRFPRFSLLGELKPALPRPATGTNDGLDQMWRWPVDKMTGAFLLVTAVVYFNLGYIGAVRAPWGALDLDT
jgi:hypothetical protein